MKQLLSILLFVCFSSLLALAQTYEGKFLEANYDESKVPEYSLPDLMTTFDGKKISSVHDWEQIRRPEIVHFFEQNMFGEVPATYSEVKKSFKLVFEDKTLLNGLCSRKDIRITIKNDKGEASVPFVLFVPNKTSKKVPVIFLATRNDIKNTGLLLNSSQDYGITNNGLPLHQLMTRGIGLAVIDYEAFADDREDKVGKIDWGITDMFFKSGQKYTKENEWGMIAIWACALKAGMDYLEGDNSINSKQVATLGCSIGGKVALWAAVTDQRFGMTLLATAGHGGDAIWRREFGETLKNMCDYLPTWVCRNANKYANNVQEMPVDQHCLLAAMAPRPFYVSNGQHDLWADQKGQWIGTYNAAPAYHLYNKKVAFTSAEQPPINKAIVESAIGYHVRSGAHGLVLSDWERYMQFIEHHFMKIPVRSVNDVYFPNGK